MLFRRLVDLDADDRVWDCFASSANPEQTLLRDLLKQVLTSAGLAWPTSGEHFSLDGKMMDMDFAQNFAQVGSDIQDGDSPSDCRNT